MRGRLFLVATLLVPAALIAFAVASRRAPEPPELWRAPDFTLVDQSGRAFASSELRGSVWIASFVYTSCPDICPTITARVAALRDSLRSDGVSAERLRFVSISVDPETDTPPVLAEYAARFGAADPRDWAFLTGRTADVDRVVTGGFYLPIVRDAASAAPAAEEYDAARPAEGAHPTHQPHSAADAGPEPSAMIGHSDRLLLVDGAGTVRGIYSAMDPAELARIKAELRTLLD